MIKAHQKEELARKISDHVGEYLEDQGIKIHCDLNAWAEDSVDDLCCLVRDTHPFAFMAIHGNPEDEEK